MYGAMHEYLQCMMFSFYCCKTYTLLKMSMSDVNFKGSRKVHKENLILRLQATQPALVYVDENE